MTEQTKTLIDLTLDALRLAKDAEKTLYMQGFYSCGLNLKAGDEIHTCGTPACVIGWAALHKPVMDFIGFDTAATILEPYDVANHLSNVFENRYGVNITWAFAGVDAEEREDQYVSCIRDLGFPNELRKHKHLITDYPTLDDAIDFLTQIQPHAERAREQKEANSES